MKRSRGLNGKTIKRFVGLGLTVCLFLLVSELFLGYIIYQKSPYQNDKRFKSAIISLYRAFEIRVKGSQPGQALTDCPSSRRGLVNCGEFDSLLDSPEFRENFKIAYEKDIPRIKSDLKNYQASIFSFKPNTLDYLMTTNPNNEVFPDVISFDKLGGRKSFGDQTKPECWIFGGSTVWGDRVNNADTVVTALNKSDSRYNYLNFGVPGYNSNSQLSYLISLIRYKGVSPSCVIWLDGLNDGTFIHLRPAIFAFDRSSHSDRSQLVTDNGKVQCTSLSEAPDEIEVINRTKRAIEYLTLLQKYDTVCQELINTRVRNWIYSKTYRFFGNERILQEAVENHYRNALIAKKLVDTNAGFPARFHWFIQPNGELNQDNPFLNSQHFLTNRYLINKYYQSMLIEKSRGFATDLTKLDAYCKSCYIDEAHYSPSFAKIIAGNILNSMNQK